MKLSCVLNMLQLILDTAVRLSVSNRGNDVLEEQTAVMFCTLTRHKYPQFTYHSV